MNEIRISEEHVQTNLSKYRPLDAEVTESQRLTSKIAIAAIQLTLRAIPFACAVFAATLVSPTALVIALTIGGIAGAAVGFAYNRSKGGIASFKIYQASNQVFAAVDFRNFFTHTSANFACVNTQEKLRYAGKLIGLQVAIFTGVFLAAKYLPIVRHISIATESFRYGLELGALAGRAFYRHTRSAQQPASS